MAPAADLVDETAAKSTPNKSMSTGKTSADSKTSDGSVQPAKVPLDSNSNDANALSAKLSAKKEANDAAVSPEKTSSTLNNAQNSPLSGRDATAKTSRLDIRYHPKLPYSYSVTRPTSLYTVVERLGRIQEGHPESRIQRIRTKWRMYKRLLPLFLRFVKETVVPLGGARMLFFIVGKLFQSLLPTWKSRATWNLSELTRVALETKTIDRWSLLKACVVDIGVHLLEKGVEEPLGANRDRLKYRYEAIVTEEILKARVRVDSVTMQDEKIRAIFRSAGTLLGQGWQKSFMLTRLIDIFGVSSALFSEIKLVSAMSPGGNTKLAALSFASSLLFGLHDYLTEVEWWPYHTAITDPVYRRMSTMKKLAHDSGAQEQLLGLQEYYLGEYQKASRALGDVDNRIPAPEDLSATARWSSRAIAFGQRLHESLAYVLFAVHAIKNPPTGALDAAATLSNLNMLKNSSERLSGRLFNLLDSFKELNKTLQPIEHYYAIRDVKLLLKPAVKAIASGASSTGAIPSADFSLLTAVCPDTPVAHSSDTTLVDEDSIPGSPAVTAPRVERQGMSIRFEHVSFTYPNTRKKAVDDVSFEVEANTLCSVVGFSGSGKSTLIALMVRLMDPDEGQIFIDGIPVTVYEPADLYKRISYLFQHTSRVDMSVREFLKIGNIGASLTDEDIMAAAAESGAAEHIKKLKYGLDQELKAPDCWSKHVNERLLLKRAHLVDNWHWEREGHVKEDDSKNDVDSDDTKDEKDDEHYRKLLFFESAVLLDSSELDKWTTAASKIRLPYPSYREAEILEEGYDESKLEEDQEESMRCSGGEWAKIVLTRTFLRPSVDLTIIDEFSAALDPTSEARIFSKLLARPGTKVAVTHRFHLAVKSQYILFMKGGKLLEQGTHANLMAIQDGEYRKMYECTTEKGNFKEVAVQTNKLDVHSDQTQSIELAYDKGSKASRSVSSKEVVEVVAVRASDRVAPAI